MGSTQGLCVQGWLADAVQGWQGMGAPRPAVLLHLPLPPVNSRGKTSHERAVIKHLLPSKTSQQAT